MHEEVLSMTSAKEIEEKLFHQPLDNLIKRLSYMRRMERAWVLIEREYTNANLTLIKAARISGISKNHLNVCCRRATSFTFHQLLTRYRLSRAILAMKAKNYSLLEIALGNGFGSFASFERNFRNVMGVTPRCFKQSVISAELIGPFDKT
jgi:AraC-like DNA-binding protein